MAKSTIEDRIKTLQAKLDKQKKREAAKKQIEDARKTLKSLKA